MLARLGLWIHFCFILWPNGQHYIVDGLFSPLSFFLPLLLSEHVNFQGVVAWFWVILQQHFILSFLGLWSTIDGKEDWRIHLYLWYWTCKASYAMSSLVLGNSASISFYIHCSGALCDTLIVLYLNHDSITAHHVWALTFSSLSNIHKSNDPTNSFFCWEMGTKLIKI